MKSQFKSPRMSLSDNGPMMAMKENRVEEAVVAKIVELVGSALDIHYNEKRNFEALLKNLIYVSLDSEYNNEGLLQQYFAIKIDNLAKQFKDRLRIDQNVKVDHDSNYNKFGSICDYIEQNYVKIEDIKSDGTFERINEKGLKTFSEVSECDRPCDCEGPSQCGCEERSESNFGLVSR